MARNLPLRRLAPFAALSVAYVAARWLAFDGAGAREFRDTIDYNQVAAAPLFSIKFLAGDHPPTVPLAYKLLGGSDGVRLAGQLVLSITCWLALAAAVATGLRVHRVRLLAFAAVLCFSLSASVGQWDAVLLSESVSISLTAALAAAWLVFARCPTVWSLAPALVVTCLWTLARDPHAYVLLMLAAVVAVWLVSGGPRLLRGVALAGVLAIAAVSLVSAGTGYTRWEYPLQNIVAKRIAADPPALDYFRDAGMPVTPRFLELSRRYRAGSEDPFAHPAGMGNRSRRSAYVPFQFWLVDEGRRTYTRYLLTHPGYVAHAFGDLDHVLLDPDVAGYESERPPSKFGFLGDLVYVPGPVLPLVALAGALVLVAVAARRTGWRRDWAVPAFMVAASLPFAVLVWHGEVLEIDRHGLIASQFLRLGTVLLAVMALDALAGGRSQAPRDARA